MQLKGIVCQETIRFKGEPVQCDAVRVDDQTFFLSGKFLRTATLSRDKDEWQQDIKNPEEVIRALKSCEARVDIFKFWQRIPETEAKYPYYKEWRDVAAIPVTEYEHWLRKQISSKARNKVKKSSKFGVVIQETELNDELVRGIMDIFNQSPVRRGKPFWHYGKNFETVKRDMFLDLEESIFITAYYGNELIGFIKLLLADRYAMLTLILDKTNHRDKAPMNGMIAKAVEICADRKVPYIVYMMWRRGGHGEFQESNGFERIPIPEYFVPLTFKGAIVLRLGLHRGLRGLIPEEIMPWLLTLRAKWYAKKRGMPNKPAVKPPIFIVGPHRSGSTLWHNLIAMCPGVMRLTDPRFLGDRRHKDFRYFLRTGFGDLALDQNVDTMVELCFAKKNLPGLESTFWRFENIEAVNDPQLKKAISCRIKKSDRSLGAIAQIFIEEITCFSGCERACVKFPVDVGHMQELLEWFPDCRIMHITRDPRALAMSKTNDPSGTAIKVRQHPRTAWIIRKVSVWLAVMLYRRTSQLHLRFRHLNNYRLFRYEDLLAEPEKTLRDLCKFIDVEFTTDLLHPEAGIHLHQPSSLTGKQKKAFDPSAAVRWQDVIPGFDKWLITTLTKRAMKTMGYDPSTHPIFQIERRSSSNLCAKMA